MDQSSPDEVMQALSRAVWDSDEVLVTADTTSKLHRSTLTLNRAKLFAEKRSALGSIDDMSVRIEDVLNISATLGPISGTIKIATKFNTPGPPYSIGPFHRKDALKLKRIVQGYIIALQRKIDLNMVPTNELITQLYEIGEDDPLVRG
ncbi:MAG TPA: hypothetical protein VMR95_01880 [Candidatus Binatia bacterium]|nr:hypothetical protein [Candidatus Binatia bacterium]